MKRLRKCAAALAVMALCICTTATAAQAATAVQDNLEVTFTTDQSAYSQDEDISVNLTVTNTGDVTVTNVSLENLIPDGYQLADTSADRMENISLEAGENISLTTVITAVDSGEEPGDGSSGEDQENPGDGSSGEDQENPGDSGETPSGGDDQGQPGGSGSQNGQNGNSSGGDKNNSSQVSDTQQNSENISAAKSPKTGDISNIVVLLVIAGAAAGVIILAVRKHKKIISIVLSFAVVGTSLAGFSLSASAADAERKSIEISTDVTLLKSSGAETLTLQGIVEYDAPVGEETTAVLKNFGADEIYFLAGMESKITFSVEAEGEFDSVNLCDESGNVVHTMLDDGTSGDETAGDGIYTYEWTTVSDEEQFADYHAEAGGASSNEITIYFFGELTEEDNAFMQKMEETFAQIEAPYEDEQGYVSIDDVDEILAEAGAYGNELLENGDAIKCEVTDSSVVLKLSSGISFVYAPSVKGAYSNGDDPVIQFQSYQPVYSWIGTITNDPENTEIPLPDGFYNQADMPMAAAEQLDDNLYNVSYSEENLHKDSDVTPESLKEFGSNQIIVWQGHGQDCGEEVGSALVTASDYDFEALKASPISRLDYTQDLIVYVYTEEDGETKAKEAITSKYVDEYCGNLDGTYIFIGSCYGGTYGSLPWSFLHKGADAVIAFSTSVRCRYSDMMQYKTTSLLSQVNPDTGNYYKLGEALNKAKELYGYTDIEYTDGQGAYAMLFGGQDAPNYMLANEYFSGYVKVASETESAIKDAHVEISGENGTFETVTDEEGKFVCCVPPGSYQVKYWKEGYYDLESSITVNSGEPLILEEPVLLEPKYLSGISGNVIDNNGDPIDDVTVTVRNSITGEISASVMTNASGTFSAALAPAEYEVTFSKEGYETEIRSDITITDDFYQMADVIMVGSSVAEKHEIWTAEDFKNMDGSSDSYILMQNLDLTESPRIEFNGTFDGNGYTISIPFSENNGMFSTLGEQAVVENCIIDYGTYSSTMPPANYYDDESGFDFGGIALDNNGTISKCEANGSIILSRYYSGQNVMIGTFSVVNNGEISHCRSNVDYTIVGHQSAWWYVISGIGGDPWSEGTIENCLNTGDIDANIVNESSEPHAQIVSIAGIGTYNITNCANTGDITLDYSSILINSADAATRVGFIYPYELSTTGFDLVFDGFPEKLRGQGGSYISEDCILDYTNSTADYDSNRIFEKKHIPQRRRKILLSDRKKPSWNGGIL